jgi:hypothetical protein
MHLGHCETMLPAVNVKNDAWRLDGCSRPVSSPTQRSHADWASVGWPRASGLDTSNSTKATWPACTHAPFPAAARLSAEQRQRVLAALKQGALKAGFDTDRWTLQRIRAVLLVAFGVCYNAHYLACRLKALGWSPLVKLNISPSLVSG